MLAAAAALRATLNSVDDAARRAEGNDAVATRASHVMGAFDLATATDDEAAGWQRSWGSVSPCTTTRRTQARARTLA